MDTLALPSGVFCRPSDVQGPRPKIQGRGLVLGLITQFPGMRSDGEGKGSACNPPAATAAVLLLGPIMDYYGGKTVERINGVHQRGYYYK